MKRHSAFLFCIALSMNTGIALEANAQDLKAAQNHAAAAKALAYEPGQDLTSVYDTLCRPALSPKGPVEPELQVAPSLAERKVPPRSQWYTEPVQAFDNLYYIGSTQDSTWVIKTFVGIFLVDTDNDSTITIIPYGIKCTRLQSA